MQTLTKTKTRSDKTFLPKRNGFDPQDAAYRSAWQRFWVAGERLNKLWKTKKTSLQVLREDRG